MKAIVYIEPDDNYREKFMTAIMQSVPDEVFAYFTTEAFTEAVRRNTEPKPIIIFDAVDTDSLTSLNDIKNFISDSILFVIVGDENTYRKAQMAFSIYPRSILFRDDDPEVLSVMLGKIASKKTISVRDPMRLSNQR